MKAKAKKRKKPAPALEYLPAIKRGEVKAAPPGMASMYVMQVFENADLRYRLPGLKVVCRKYRIPVDELKKGESVLFVNRRRDYINLVVGNESDYPVLASYRFPPGMKLPKQGLEAIAQAFKSPRQINADERLKAVLERLNRKEVKSANATE